MRRNSHPDLRRPAEYLCRIPEEMGWPIDYEQRLRSETISAATAFIGGSLRILARTTFRQLRDRRHDLGTR